MTDSIHDTSLPAPHRAAISYSPYGGHHETTNRHPSLRYDGEFFDSSLQAYHLGQGYRLYKPSLMRFMSPDTLSPFQRGGINAYAAFGNDPIGRMDPDGHAPQPSQPKKNMQFYKRQAATLSASSSALAAREAVRKKHDLSRLPVLKDSQPEEYNEYLKIFQKKDDVSASHFQIIANKEQAKSIEKSRKFVFTRDAELITGDERAIEFPHPMLNYFSEKDPGVISAGYLFWKEDVLMVSDYSGHYYLSAKGRVTGEPVVTYLKALKLKTKLIRSYGTMHG